MSRVARSLSTVLENWVERGDAPGNLVQTQPTPPRSRPMCRYPEWPQYKGGDPDAAASFRCVRRRGHRDGH